MHTIVVPNAVDQSRVVAKEVVIPAEHTDKATAYKVESRIDLKKVPVKVLKVLADQATGKDLPLGRRAVLEAAVWSNLAQLADQVPAPPAAHDKAETNEDTSMAIKSKSTKKAAKGAKKAATTSNGRSKKFPVDGTIEVLAEKNPKREGSQGYKNFDLYRNGMKVGTFLEKGGTRADLRYDVEHKFIKVASA